MIESERSARRAELIYEKYFKNKPAADDLGRAILAYHTNDSNYRTVDGAHSFYNDKKTCSCAWCGRTRAEVRWDGLNPECANRPKVFPNIADVILTDETKYFALLAKAEVEVPRILAKVFSGVLTGKALSVFQNTYGFDPDSVASALNIEIESMMPDYEIAQEDHRRKSGEFRPHGS
jgi:hypothetical protein